MNILKILGRQNSINRVKSLITTSNYKMTEITNQISFTSRFFQALEEKLSSKNRNSFLRLEINAGEGCEGFTYKFKFDEVLNSQKDFIKTQTTLSKEGKQEEKVIFAVNSEEVKLLKGATLDYADEMMRQIFYVKQNPNAELQCSCKVSFSPKQGLI